MTMRSRLALLALAALLPGAAPAAEWYLYGSGEDDLEFLFVDAASFATVDATRRGRFLRTLVDLGVREEQLAFRCASREMAQVSLETRDPDGRVTATRAPARLRFEPVRPGTVNGLMLELACAASPRAYVTEDLAAKPVPLPAAYARWLHEERARHLRAAAAEDAGAAPEPVPSAAEAAGMAGEGATRPR